MIWKIAKKEFLPNLMTFKFAVGAAACSALCKKTFFYPVTSRGELSSQESCRKENHAKVNNQKRDT